MGTEPPLRQEGWEDSGPVVLWTGAPACGIPVTAPVGTLVGCSRPPRASREEKKICLEKI